MRDVRAMCLVTGGAGFIGSHVATALVARGLRVRVVDNLSTGHLGNLEAIRSRIAFIEGDLTDPAVARAATAGVETVYHLAALPSVPLSLVDPWRAHDANVNATVRLLEACISRGVARFVFSGSCAVYGNAAEIPKRETMATCSASPYAAAKLASEQYALSFARSGLLNAVGLRYFNVFGPRQDPASQYAAAIPRFLEAAAAGEPVTIYGDGMQTRDFIFVGDVVDANLRAAATPAASGCVLNVGSGRQTSLVDLLEVIRHVTGLHVRCRFEAARVGDVRHSLADVSAAESLMGFRASVSLSAGLRRTWESMPARRAVAKGAALASSYSPILPQMGMEGGTSLA
jgi:UDP-N-acetylglucosamine/UDP-N-acetyl-alpha-D-glucosaminouronate 4-epimerase